MSRREAPDRLARTLRAAAGERFVRDELAARVSEALHPWVAHDGLRLSGMNPVTGAVSFGFLHGLGPDLARAQLFDSYLGADPFSPVDIARLPEPVGLLGGNDRSTPGHRRALETLTAHGAGSEARLLLRDGRGMWGLLALLRSAGGTAFDHDDARRLTLIAPSMIALLRGYASAELPRAGDAYLPAGIVVVGPDDRVRSVTAEGRAWLREISPARGLAPEWMPDVSMREIALAARRHAIDPTAPRPVAYSPAAFLGRRVAVHAQPLNPDGTGDVAVLLQDACGTRVLPEFAAWHGLTAREGQVVRQLHSGAAPKQIARALDVSVHTVNTHLKAVFRKIGVSGRDELRAILGH
ncbi:helix-turn-helix transcriptional regulator [Embleya sp. NPDC055664]